MSQVNALFELMILYPSLLTIIKPLQM